MRVCMVFYSMKWKRMPIVRIGLWSWNTFQDIWKTMLHHYFLLGLFTGCLTYLSLLFCIVHVTLSNSEPCRPVFAPWTAPITTLRQARSLSLFLWRFRAPKEHVWYLSQVTCIFPHAIMEFRECLQNFLQSIQPALQTTEYSCLA